MKRLSQITLLASAISLALMTSACGNNASEASSSSSVQGEASDTVSTPKSTASGAEFTDGVLETNDLKIEITDVRKIAIGDEGNEYGEKPVIAFWYNTTNKTDEPMPPNGWIWHFDAVQDNDPNKVNELEVTSHPDMSLIDNSFEDIKPGGTVPDAIGYELDDETTPVKLVASLDFGSEDIGAQSFQIP